MNASRHLLIVFHSQSGFTRQMTEAVVRGAGHEDIAGVEVKTLAALEAGVEDVRWAQAIILGTPENFGYMSGAMKYFFDRIYYPCLEETEGLPCAIFIRAGNDGAGALRSLERILGGLKWRIVCEPLIVRGELTAAHLAQCEELGMTMAAGLEAGIY